jgi:hypothetical protein
LITRRSRDTPGTHRRTSKLRFERSSRASQASHQSDAIRPGGGPKLGPRPGPGPRTEILPPSKFDRKVCVKDATRSLSVSPQRGRLESRFLPTHGELRALGGGPTRLRCCEGSAVAAGLESRAASMSRLQRLTCSLEMVCGMPSSFSSVRISRASRKRSAVTGYGFPRFSR